MRGFKGFFGVRRIRFVLGGFCIIIKRKWGVSDFSEVGLFFVDFDVDFEIGDL